MTYDIRSDHDGSLTVEIYARGHKLIKELGPFSSHREAVTKAKEEIARLSHQRIPRRR